jgi:hypothetical protein
MRVWPIENPLPGERVIGVWPTMREDVTDAGWRRRLNFFTGRSVTAPALTREQDERTGHLTMRGQAVSPGVVSGLEATLALRPEPVASAPALTTVSPGILAPGIRPPISTIVTQTLAPGVRAPLLPLTPTITVPAIGVRPPIGTISPVVGVGGIVPVPVPTGGAPGGTGTTPPIGGIPIPVGGTAPPGGPGTTPPTGGIPAPGGTGTTPPIGVIRGPVGGPLPPIVPKRPIWELHLLPGAGLCGSGEDVVVPQPVVCALDDIVRLSLGLGPAPTSGDTTTDPLLALFAENQLTVGILRLEPVTIDVFGRTNAEDPCEQDPSQYAFDDETMIDACRISFFPWPAQGFVPLPAASTKLRNELANAIFEFERTLGYEQLLPWEADGVAIGLVAFDAQGIPTFLDRSAVVRQGGKARRRTALVDNIGSPFFWQARMRQLGEEVLWWRAQGSSPSDMASHLHFLPPVGFLPVETVPDLRAGASPFFPGFTVDAKPVPLEQLDELIAGTAALQRFDLTLPDQVRVLVPVPQELYDPNLLAQENPDPEFATTLAGLRSTRNTARERRDDVRGKSTALLQALNGTAFDPGFTDTDPPDPGAAADPTVAEKPATDPIDELPYGTTLKDGVLGVDAFEALKTSLTTASPFTADDLQQLLSLGLRGFVPVIEARLKTANDAIDFGYLSSQTDIYRLRQHMLGNADASRLAVSPALATIAQGTTAAAVREDLVAYFNKIKMPTDGIGNVPPLTTSPPPPPPPPTGGVAVVETVSPAKQTFESVGAIKFIATNTPKTLLPLAQITLGSGGIQQAAVPPANVQLEVQTAGAAIPKASAGADQRRAIDDILDQDPGAGNTYDFGTVTVGERLQAPAAQFAHDAASDNFDSTISTFLDLHTSKAINLTGIPVIGKVVGKSDTSDGTTVSWEGYQAALDGKKVQNRVETPTKPTESDFFQVGVTRIENNISNLRAIEARIREYRVALASCRDLITSLQALVDQTTVRLKAIGDELTGDRHEVATAYALLQDEIARANAVMARRNGILASNVPFVAFHRPRVVDTLDAAPMRPLDPALTEQPIPACLSQHGGAPPELNAMVELLRDAPSRWFTYVPSILDGLDDLAVLHTAVLSARARAYATYAANIFSLAPRVSPGFYAEPLGSAYDAQQAVIRGYRLKTAALDVTTFAGLSWLQSREQALDHISLGDLADGKHGRAAVARAAAQELDNMAQVATCIYAKVSGVLPVLRLEWAERLSQATGVSLRNLASLPRWGEVPALDRSALQILADWLYQRIDASQPDAEAMMHDVVRVCILLASHAPVNQIVAGHVPEPTSTSIGGVFKVSFDPAVSMVRVGMQVTAYASDQSLVRGVVEDLVDGAAVTRVIRATNPSFTLNQGSSVQFAASQTLPARLVV